MLKTILLFYSFALIQQINLVTTLIVVGVIFFVLLIFGVLKSVKLKKESNRLSRNSTLESDEDNKVYRDFTDGHLYDSY